MQAFLFLDDVQFQHVLGDSTLVAVSLSALTPEGKQLSLSWPRSDFAVAVMV